jgi:hypothetical protein
MKPFKILLLTAAVSTGWFTAVNLAFAQTWTLTSASNNYWQGVVSSADGVKLVAVANGGGIYTSTNTSSPNNAWGGVASSADGVKLVAVVDGGGIYPRFRS